MTSEQFILTAQWEPSPAQSRVADLLAQCWSQTASAEETRVALKTVQRWWADPEFREYVRDIQRGYAEGYNEEFSLLIAEALMIERRALRGEIPHDDPRAILAHDILSKTAFRVAVATSVVDRRARANYADPAALRERLTGQLPPGDA